MATNVTKALWVTLEAKPGRENDVEQFLDQGLSIVEGEPKTVRWFGVRVGPSTFAIFDAFPDEDGRNAHLSGDVGKALGEQTGELFDEPSIQHLDVIAEKAPA